MGHWYLKKTKPSAPGALMAFYESNYPSFTKRGFSPTDHLCSFHLHINWKLLGVKKYLYVSNCSCSNALARCKRALFPQSSPPRRNHKPIADLEQWNSGAFGWYQLGRGGAVCQHSLQGAVCLCSLGQRLSAGDTPACKSLAVSPSLCQLWLKERVFCIVSAR